MLNLTVNGSHELLEDDALNLTATIEEGDYCAHCGETIAEYAGLGWTHDSTDSTPCRGEEDDPDGHRATPALAAPGNWAGVTIDPDEGTTRVEISVGDPRGCLTMTLRRVRDEDGTERLLLSVPHPDDSTPHVALREIAPGTYQIGA